KLPPSAKAVGDKLSARFLVLSSVSSVNGKATAELQAWDLLTGNKLTGITVDASSGDASSTYTAADKVAQWIEHPPAPATSFKVPEVAKKWWFWAAVGGAAAVVATGVVVAQPSHRPDLVLGTY
ncbi:MAG: PEGA domain-containing protein, partial [Myxococcaceae bacterium]